jgi:ectoine hydroxylase-related dioxygenase (phytanoyl-CoA dioxygenase family)
MDLYEYERYLATPSTAKDILAEYGVAIIPDILTEKECDDVEEGMWDTLAHITQTWETPISEINKKSWRSIKDLFPKHGMLLQNWGIGHAQFIWDIRQNPKVVKVFAKLWNVSPEDLLVSFDGASFSMPPETTNIGWYRKTKYHTDQSPLNSKFDCIQGWINAFDTNEGDATLAFLEGSHKYHKDLYKKFNIDEKADWYILNDPEHVVHFIKAGCEEKRIKCPRGSLVLWDSRTFHTGSEPIKGRAKPNFRCCVYVCYKEKNLATKAALTKRKKAFEEMRLTTHNPVKALLFPKSPRTYGAPMPDITELPAPKLTPLGRQLVGY